MNLFRSEEHLVRWLGGRKRGETISVAKLSEVAHAWLADRFSPRWRPRTVEESQAIFDRLRLTGDFWGLAEAPMGAGSESVLGDRAGTGAGRGGGRPRARRLEGRGRSLGATRFARLRSRRLEASAGASACRAGRCASGSAPGSGRAL